MQIKHCHPLFQGQEQYDKELRRVFTTCIRKLRQMDGRVIIGGIPDKCR